MLTASYVCQWIFHTTQFLLTSCTVRNLSQNSRFKTWKLSLSERDVKRVISINTAKSIVDYRGQRTRLVTCTMTMAYSLSVLSLIYVLSVLVTLGPVYCKVFNASQGTQVKDSAPNVYNTYNTFCAGLSKKIEVLLHDVKNELSEMREEIKSLKENNTISKGNILSSRWKSPFDFTVESRVLNYLGKAKLVRIISAWFEKSGVKLQCLRWMDVRFGSNNREFRKTESSRNWNSTV